LCACRLLCANSVAEKKAFACNNRRLMWHHQLYPAYSINACSHTHALSSVNTVLYIWLRTVLAGVSNLTQAETLTGVNTHTHTHTHCHISHCTNVTGSYGGKFRYMHRALRKWDIWLDFSMWPLIVCMPLIVCKSTFWGHAHNKRRGLYKKKRIIKHGKFH